MLKLKLIAAKFPSLVVFFIICVYPYYPYLYSILSMHFSDAVTCMASIIYTILQKNSVCFYELMEY